jgi:transposase
VLSDADRLTLERWSRSRSASFRLVLRSRIVLMVRAGVSRAATAKALATTARTVRLWCQRFDEGGTDALRRDAPGRGRRVGLSLETVQAIVDLTLHPAGGERPTARQLARAVGTSPASVCRVWATQGIRPAVARRQAAGGSDRARVARHDDRGARCETNTPAGEADVVADQLLHGC